MINKIHSKKKVIIKMSTLLAVVLILIGCSAYYYISLHKIKEPKKGEYTVIEKIIDTSKKDRITWELRKYEEGYYVYKNRKLERKGFSSGSKEILSFDTKGINASDSIMKREDYLLGTDTKIYRGSVEEVLAFYAFIQNNGSKILSHYTANYMETFFKNEDETMYRFLYIVKTKKDGVVLYAPLQKNITIPSVSSLVDEW